MRIVKLSDPMLSPDLWTAPYLIEAGKTLTVGCDGCRVLRGTDLGAIALVRPVQRIAEMRFRCSKCGGPGHPVVSWRSVRNEYCAYEFRSGVRRGEW